MVSEPIEIEGTWEQISAQASRYTGHKLRLTILPEESAMPLKDSRSLDEKLAEIAALASPEELAKLPTDLSEQLDHYIYGIPKR